QSMHYNGTAWTGPLMNDKGNAAAIQSVTAGYHDAPWACSAITSGDNVYSWGGSKNAWVGQKGGTQPIAPGYNMEGEGSALGAQAPTTRLCGGTWIDVTGPLFPQVPAAIRFTAAHGTSKSDVWFVGSQGWLMHFDGQKLESRAGATNWGLRGVFATSPKDVW